MRTSARYTGRGRTTQGRATILHRYGLGSLHMRRVLVITASTEQRPSTPALDAILDEFDRRDDTSVELWYLRDDQGPRRPGSRVVDDLRARGPGHLLEVMGMPRIASAVKGYILSRWRRAASPEIVILDDGLGLRALQGWRPRRLVARINSDLPADANLEMAPVSNADLILKEASAEWAAPSEPVIETPTYLRDFAHVLSQSPEDDRLNSRKLLDIPPSSPLVVGWGADGWLDGPDLFVRGLWMLNERRGCRAHGLWITSHGSEALEKSLYAEARRCGVDDRFAISREDQLSTRLCGDAVFLPCRAPHDPMDLLAAVASGLEVVTFPVHSVEDPAIRTVDHLDLEAAASVITQSLVPRRAERADQAMRRLDVRHAVGVLLEAAER